MRWELQETRQITMITCPMCVHLTVGPTLMLGRLRLEVKHARLLFSFLYNQQKKLQFQFQ